MCPPACSRPNRPRHLKHLVLDSSYPAIAQPVKVLIGAAALCGRAIVAGTTGAGATVVDVRRAAGVKPIPVTITGRDQVTTAAGGLKLAEVLRKELHDFKIRIDPQTAHDGYAAWRAGAHDDLVVVAAAVAWDADRTRAPVARVSEY
jgi:hypothetical protein